MSLLCLFGLHRPSLSSIARRDGRLIGLCERCARPLERDVRSGWQASAPVYEADERTRA